jgi:hypothetical protein
VYIVQWTIYIVEYNLYCYKFAEYSILGALVGYGAKRPGRKSSDTSEDWWRPHAGSKVEKVKIKCLLVQAFGMKLRKIVR